MNLIKFFFDHLNRQPEKDFKVIPESKMHSYIEAANKIQDKEYDQAIADLKKLLKATPSGDNDTLSMIHINLMEAYFKNRKAHEGYLEKSTCHAKEALKQGHNTGLAPYRLVVNLTKEKRINQAIEVCTLVTNPSYKFSPHGFKQKPDFEKRLKELKQKQNRAEDKPGDEFFTEAEVEMAFSNSEKSRR